jgi:hypothetical protein
VSTPAEGGPLQVATLLNAVNSNQTGAWFDAGRLVEELALEVSISGTVSAMSVQFQGSLDKSETANVGTAITAHGAATATGPWRYFRAVLSGYTGTGTVTAKLGFAAGL